MKKSEKNIIADLLRELSKRVNALDDQAFGRLLRGDAQVEIKICTTVQDKRRLKKEIISDSRMSEILSVLESMDSRDKGYKILKEECKTKDDLIRLSKYLDLPVLKSDKVEQIRERILEATIGYRIRSAAIQGRTGKNT